MAVQVVIKVGAGIIVLRPIDSAISLRNKRRRESVIFMGRKQSLTWSSANDDERGTSRRNGPVDLIKINSEIGPHGLPFL